MLRFVIDIIHTDFLNCLGLYYLIRKFTRSHNCAGLNCPGCMCAAVSCTNTVSRYSSSVVVVVVVVHMRYGQSSFLCAYGRYFKHITRRKANSVWYRTTNNSKCVCVFVFCNLEYTTEHVFCYWKFLKYWKTAVINHLKVVVITLYMVFMGIVLFSL
jgi:hypothetical protein